MFRDLLHFAQIAAGAKSPSGSRQHYRASAMFACRRKGEFQFAAHLARQCIKRVGPVEGYYRDCLAHFEQQSFVTHSFLIPVATNGTFKLVRARFNLPESQGEGPLQLLPIELSLGLRAAGAEAFTAENRPSRGRLERHGVGLAALVAGNFEPLPLASTAAPRPAEIGATGIATGLAAFWLAQIPFLVVLLFTFCKWKGFAAFGALDVNVWHD